MDFITKQSIKESIEDEEDKLTREWTEKMACAITEQTWSLVIRKVANAAIFVALMSILIIVITLLTVSSKAGCITAIITFVTLGFITEVMARVVNTKNKDAVLKASINIIGPKSQ
jgi:hypothetical protein